MIESLNILDIQLLMIKWYNGLAPNPPPRTTMPNLLIIVIITKYFHSTATLNKLAETERQISNFPSARNSGGKSKQRSSKDGNKYLKVAFSDAATHAVQYYPVIRKYHSSLLRKKNKQVAKTILAKEIASIVYYVLKNKSDFNNKFKGLELQHKKSLQWPRVVSPCV
jgi:hypothetical protein